MCYAIPGKVKKIDKKSVLVDYFGEEKRAINEFYDIAIGDFVCAQGGFVIKKVPHDEAQDILSAWKELFFQLQDIDLRLSRVDFQRDNIDKNLTRILDKALENIPLKNEELLHLINLNDPKARELLFNTANFIRQKYHKNACCVHGIIEISNYCKNSCHYCGISTCNKNLKRYRMSPQEIIDTAVEAVEIYGFQALVLQSGEDTNYTIDELCDIIKSIKQKTPCLICISFGEVGLEGLGKLYDAGARAILMRFETSNPDLYKQLHPDQELQTRLDHIKKAYELGYMIITGALIGLPNQTQQDIINDIYLAKQLHAEAYSFGPFLPHPETPLADYKPPQEGDVLKTLALIRLVDPENAKILVTTALETLSATARRSALLSGANSMMLNVTPIKYRQLYSIYPNKAHTKEAINTQIDEAVSLLKSLGRAPTDLGVSSPEEKSENPGNLSKDDDFIDEAQINSALSSNKNPDAKKIEDILQKSLSIQTLTLDETAALINVTDKATFARMKDAAAQIKRKVYDNRIVTFAPLYLSNECVNNCLYCGFRKDNSQAKRKTLSIDEVIKETQVLAGKIGHKRLIAVYGEHPSTGIDYMVQTMKAIYGVKEKTKNGFGQIRRININAAPLSVEDLKTLKTAGIGTFQVFQETYHHDTYKQLHPKNTIKSDYKWRLYCMHRALEAGVDDVGIGALFGLYDWKFEVLGLLSHARELEEKFGIGPHTISFPRLEPALNTPFTQNTRFKVSDEDFEKLVTVIRLAVPYTGMILTARENAQVRRKMIPLGCTQTDASSCIGIGSYSGETEKLKGERQQFFLGDERSLDDVVRELAEMGYITSFCTAGYRCGRTGNLIMDLLKTGKEGKFCKLNAVLTFREWLDDFASDNTRQAGEKIIEKELNEVKSQNPSMHSKVLEYYARIKKGERDLYF